MSVREAQERISSREYAEWVAFSRLEPFGFEAEFLGHAQTAQVIANVNRGKDSDPLEVSDFMPKLPRLAEEREAEDEPQSVDQLKQVAYMLTIALGGSVKER